MVSLLTETITVGRVDGIRLSPEKGTNLLFVGLDHGLCIGFTSQRGPTVEPGDCVAVARIEGPPPSLLTHWTARFNNCSWILCTAQELGIRSPYPDDVARLSRQRCVGERLVVGGVDDGWSSSRPMLVVSNGPLED